MKTSHPLLSFLTAFIFAGTLAVLALSFSLDNVQYICAFFVALIAVWIWVGFAKNAIWRMALVLSLSATLTVGRVLLAVFPEDMLFLLIPLLGGFALVAFLVLWFSLGSLVEVFWVLGLAARVKAEQLETWRSLLYSRAPLSGWWVRRTVVEKLQKDGSALAVTLLANTVSDPAAEARSLAFYALEKLTAKTGIDALCAVWAANRQPVLAGLITRNKWRATEPPEVLTLSALLLGETDYLRKCKAELVPPLAQAALDADKVIAERAAQTLRALENVEAQESLCRVVIERENAPAQEAALIAGYLPRETQQRALFLFITRQWERYDSLDFDRRLMRLAYLASPEPVQQRIRESLRAAGRIDFLPIIAGDGSGERAAQLTSGESEVLAQTLIANRDWAALWKQVFDLPFHWSVRAMLALVENGWKPVDGEEQSLFAELSSLAAGGLLMEPAEARELFPLAVLQATARVPGRINAVSFAPSHPGIAIGTGQGKVVIWNYQTAKRERVLLNFSHSVGEVVFCPDGTLLCAERTNGSEACSIFAFADVWNDATSFNLGTHSGSVTALAPAGAAQILSAGSDNNLVLWNFAARKEIKRRVMTDWARNLHVSPDGTQVLLLRKGLDLLSLPDLRDIAKAGKNAVFRSAAFAPDGKSMFAGTYSGKLFVYQQNPKQSDSLIAAKKPLAEYPPSERLEATETLKRLSLLVVAASGGEIRFFSLDGNTSLGNVTVPGGQVTSLNISPDEAFMAIGSAGATLTLWDLRSMDLRLLLEHPFAQAEVTTMPTLTAMLGHANLSARAHQVLQFAQAVLRQRFRFSIELGEAPSIALGEFDIEIEG